LYQVSPHIIFYNDAYKYTQLAFIIVPYFGALLYALLDGDKRIDDYLEDEDECKVTPKIKENSNASEVNDDSE
jgi:hypothetical protein